MPKNSASRLPTGPGIGPSIKKPNNFFVAMKKLASFLSQYKTMMLISVIIACIGVFCNVWATTFIREMVSLFDPSYTAKYAWLRDLFIVGDYFSNVAIFLVVLYVVSFVLSYAQTIIMSVVVRKNSYNMRVAISEKINNVSLSYYDKHMIGDVLSYITNDVDAVSQSLNQSVMTFITSILTIIFAIFMMFLTDWRMTITVILSSLVGMACIWLIIKISQKYFGDQQTYLAKLNGYIEEFLSGHSVVKLYCSENQVMQSYVEINNRFRSSAWKAQAFSGLMMPLMVFAGNVGYTSVCIVGALLIAQGSLENGVSVIAAFLIYARLFSMSFGQVAQGFATLQTAAAATENIFSLLDSDEISDDSEKTEYLDPKNVRGDVEFEQVVFGYLPGKTIINDFNLSIKAGQKVAIVGSTGSGKTTIVNILMQFYELNRGCIKVDGVDLAKLKKSNVHDLFCMVLQDTWLFNGTFAENIIYNKSDTTKQKMIDICNSIGIHSFIEKLPNGYDTIMDENNPISVGQKQLITIARAMFMDAPILILDEATSSVDTMTEIQIQEAIDKISHGRTSFVIAHRLSTIRNADVIVVMKNGSIVEQGNHDYLMSLGGYYSELNMSQFNCDLNGSCCFNE